ncbi:MAG: hypothetical protein B7Y43_00695 [Sphingomonas sp. 28-62-20]|uniref:hypothetical protein n=1 Tax=Sphingomonas sp. 28-62-20 TaxID=1970433 RepID=UPI000BD779C0|nr:MAG: hypothetical protein B7Y43_00695 [Sphingomonas sp. 28-62-20]
MKHAIRATTALALGLAACAPSATNSSSTANMASTDTMAPMTNDMAAAPADNALTNPAPVASPVAMAGPKVLTLEGLGALKIGQPVPKDSDWTVRGAQEPNGCGTVSSPDYPGVYAIVEGGKVRRISVGARSDVKLREGIGVGATEKQVMDVFGGFRATPHKYEDAPAKYISAPNAESGDSALRFEIGSDGKVSIIHVGAAPVLQYVEGCS